MAPFVSLKVPWRGMQKKEGIQNSLALCLVIGKLKGQWEG